MGDSIALAMIERSPGRLQTTTTSRTALGAVNPHYTQWKPSVARCGAAAAGNVLVGVEESIRRPPSLARNPLPTMALRRK
jgi:hypothetical protein